MIVPVSHPIQNVLHRDGLIESPYQFCKEGGYEGQHAKFDELIQALRDSDNAEDLLGGAQKPTTEDQVVAAYCGLRRGGAEAGLCPDRRGHGGGHRGDGIGAPGQDGEG